MFVVELSHLDTWHPILDCTDRVLAVVEATERAELCPGRKYRVRLNGENAPVFETAFNPR